MNAENQGCSERLVTAAYVRQGAQGRRAHELRLRALLEQVMGPPPPALRTRAERAPPPRAAPSSPISATTVRSGAELTPRPPRTKVREGRAASSRPPALRATGSGRETSPEPDWSRRPRAAP